MKVKILIVEDEIRIREGLARLLIKLDAACEIAGEADNGRAGLEMARQVRPDIIFTDIKMPEMDGLEMLTELYQEGCRAKAIVLSAYSEFEYAKKAIHLGVKEYLLKPLVVEDISEALKRARKELEQESGPEEEMFENVSKVFENILWGNLTAEEKIKEKLWAHFRIPVDSQYDVICCCTGKRYQNEKKAVVRELQQILEGRHDLNYLILEADREQMLVILIYQNPDSQDLKRWVQYWIMQNPARKWRGAAGFISGMSLESLREGMETLLSYMEWNISLGDDVLISYPQITRLQTSPCVYPLEIENQLKLAVCAGQKEKIQKCLENFYHYFRSGALYSPREIKECYVRFLWAFMNVGKEIGILRHEELEQQKLLERIMGAKTSEELSEAGAFLEAKLEITQEEATHLTIKRAKSLIQEFYQTGITLDEIASKLNITPEYLGTKFHREVGVNFSTYIKNFRITKAKELLIGTNLKLYEIAEKTGYSDSKYFSRVFKEVTGQLPADYRKTHK